MGLLSPALTVVVQNSVPLARMGSATTNQQFVRQVGAALASAPLSWPAYTKVGSSSERAPQ